jgi:drug/metabolite transporter (DMT)-like permease
MNMSWAVRNVGFMPSGKGRHMRAITIAGIVLIVIGVVVLVYQGITYTTREKVLEVGPVEVRKETQKTIPLPPLAGGVALAGGIVLVLVGARRV